MFRTTLRKIILLLKKRLGLQSPAVILPYHGFGNQQQVLLAGHVLDDRMLHEAEVTDRVRKNIWAMLSRYLSTSVPEVRVSIELLGKRAVVKTDENGFFEKTFFFDPPLSASGWQSARYCVLDQIGDKKELLFSQGEVYIESENASLGIISDVDDTILVSHATQLLKKLRLILTKNARTRLPFKGVSAFYRALQAGKNGNEQNPIFYVSSSSWNLYDFLVDFCRIRGIPKGPFLLQDLHTSLFQLYRTGSGSHDHKLEKIRSLLEIYFKLPFILIGDSGQRDPDLYAAAARAFPGRIKAIYIRDVAAPEKAVVVDRIATRLKGEEVEMLLVRDTAQAARHAYTQLLISRSGLEEVLAETAAQEGKKESLIAQIIETEKIK